MVGANKVWHDCIRRSIGLDVGGLTILHENRDVAYTATFAVEFSVPWMIFPSDQMSGHAQYRQQVEEQLFPGESVLAWCLADLDENLRFADTLLVLTDRRLLVAPADPRRSDAASVASRTVFRGFVLADVDELSAREYSGTGTLEVRSHQRVLETWHYTARQSSAVRSLVAAFVGVVRGEVQTHSVEDDVATEAAPAAFGTLFRLTRFARPFARPIAIGFVLALATTAAGLIPPYLTMPLLDDILIPYQQRSEQAARDTVALGGAAVSASAEAGLDGRRVAMYLLGLGGAAVIAWLLDWAKGVVMARRARAFRPTCAMRRLPICRGFRWTSSAVGGPAI